MIDRSYLAAGIGVAIILSITTGAAAAPSETACAKAIFTEVTKLENTVAKGLAKCDDAYRKDIAKGDATLAKAAPACQTQLNKLFAATTGTVAKSITKLTGLVGKSCDDTTLYRLGHLTTAFGDRWARAVAVSALQLAYEQHLAGVRSAREALLALADATTCPSCDLVATPPCFKSTCTLSAGSSQLVFQGQLPGVGGGLGGAWNFQLCKLDGVTPTDEYLVLGSPARTVSPVALPQGLSSLCVTPLSAEGFVACHGQSAPLIPSSCADHTIEAGVDECEAGGAVCLLDSADPVHADVTNGGTCLSVSNGASPGSAFINSTVDVRYISLLGGFADGPDGLPCTADDTLGSTQSTVALTTLFATGTVKDPSESSPEDFFEVGAFAPFNCTLLPQGSLSGARLVAAFPVLHGVVSSPGETASVATLTLSCE